MSEPAVEPNVTQDQQYAAETSNEAPWASYLNDLPDSVKPLVEPKFKEWDANVTKRFQQVHTQYEPLKAWQPLAEQGYDFNDVQQAIQFAQLVNEDPQRVYEALVAQYGFGGEQGQVEPEAEFANAGELPDITQHPEFAKIAGMTEQMAQILVSQQQAQQQQQEDAALSQHIAALKQQHGEFDEDYVLTKVYAGADWNKAIEAYQNLVGSANQPQAPVVMGSGGGLPSQTVNPAQMSDKDRKALVAQMIAQANQQ